MLSSGGLWDWRRWAVVESVWLIPTSCWGVGRGHSLDYRASSSWLPRSRRHAAAELGREMAGPDVE